MVVIRPYSAEWPAAFQRVREELWTACAPLDVLVEHIGSTAVPGLAAKPVLDVLLGVGALSDLESKIPALERLGYAYVARYERELPMRRYFVKSGPDTVRVHVHGVERGKRLWNEHLKFRDALRADPTLRARYAALKLRLATEFAHDKSAYTAAKAPFIEAVLADRGPEGGLE